MRRIAPWMLGAVILSIIYACDVNSPDRFVRAPIIRSYSPESVYFGVLTGDTVTFSVSALDPDNGPLSYEFILADSVVVADNKWTYVVHDTGTVDVSARVSNRASRSVISWRLVRVAPENTPPVIVEFEPLDLNPAVRVGKSILFSMGAEDPEGKPLSYVITFDDSLVSASNRYTYHATKVGRYSVKAIVTDGEAFARQEWTLDVLAQPDSVPPAGVIVTGLETGSETGELVTEWTTVGDDGFEGLPAAYIVRTSRVAINSEAAWSQASDRPGEPEPIASGQTLSMVIPFLPPADVVYVAVRAVDDFGNLSPLTNSLSAVVKGNDVFGTVRDAVTGEPLPDIRIELVGVADTTDAFGRYAFDSLPDRTTQVRLRDEDDAGAYGAYYDIETQGYTIRDEHEFDFWMIPNVVLESADYNSFLDFAYQMTDQGGPYSDLFRIWDEPIPVHVIPFTMNGLDYEPVVKAAFDEWEAVTGFDLFTYVDSIPDMGLYVTYADIIGLGGFFRLMESTETGLPILGEIVLSSKHGPTTADHLETVAGHEIGHGLGLMHSTDNLHLMIGGRTPLATEPSTDEINLVRIVYHMPRGQSISWFKFD